MIQTLFHDSEKDQLDSSEAKKDLDHDKAKDALKVHVQSHKKFTSNFCSYLLAKVMPYLCFCLHYPLLRKSSFYRKFVTKHKKLDEAIRRLTDEQDMLHVIKISRVVGFLNKFNFKSH